MNRYIFPIALIATSLVTGVQAQDIITAENTPTIERYANQVEMLLEQKYGNDFLIKLQKLSKARLLIENHPKGTLLGMAFGMTESRIIRKNLKTYIRGKYSQKEDFRKDYLSLHAIDPKADTHPFFLSSLEKRIRDNPILREDSRDFRALVYLSLFQNEMLQRDPNWIASISEDWDMAWQKLDGAEGPILASERLKREKIAQVVAKISGINPYSSVDIEAMKDNIWSDKVSPQSYYFQAYAQMRYALGIQEGGISLDTPFQHTLQVYGLSCESNTATDFINYYRMHRWLLPITERDFIALLPIRNNPMVKLPGQVARYVWGDPDQHFVGRIDGRQSSNRAAFTGYGIHPDGIAPIIDNILTVQNLTIKKDAFESRKVLDSLAKKNPVMFWYLLPVGANPDGSKQYATNPVSWESPEWKKVQGYIGQHVGLIVGAEYDALGNIRTISFFQGRNASVETVEWSVIQKTASLFSGALYVEGK